jgi:hypothetical protein
VAQRYSAPDGLGGTGRRWAAAEARTREGAASTATSPAAWRDWGEVRAASARGGPDGQSQAVTSEAAWCRASCPGVGIRGNRSRSVLVSW